MKVVSNFEGDTPGGISVNLGFDSYGGDDDDTVLFYGFNTAFNSLADNYPNSKKILLDLWSPCEFTVGDMFPDRNNATMFDRFDKVLNICPYTMEWYNNTEGNNKHSYICHPHPIDADISIVDSVLDATKSYEVCYFGGLHGKDHHECLSHMRDFNYRFISQQNYDGVTDLNVGINEKLDLVAKCRVSVCYNFVPLREDMIRCIKAYDRWEENEAFKHIDDLSVMPQLKARFFEAAICGAVNLVKRDSWNVIDRHMEPNIDYIPFDNNDELPSLIKEVNDNFDKYSKMRRSAFEKSLLYGPKETFREIDRLAHI